MNFSIADNTNNTASYRFKVGCVWLPLDSGTYRHWITVILLIINHLSLKTIPY